MEQDFNNRLLAAFLPQHLISAARLQIATNNPHIYTEHYPQVISSIPAQDPCHALNVVRFALQLEALIESFRDATTADVAVCIGIDTGSVSAGVVGSSKWHYDVVGVTVDNAILLQSSAPGHGVFVTEETRHLIEGQFTLEHIGEIWRVSDRSPGPELFPINKR
ncbi:unnamed protein product [Strongylus vulgaris]|uniref:adenylate cyclase n=1 Tax=Strongylus vulgaris TaxID=40348 RepID=A0A3P7L526_STRVU|nr:unnamed protein product [Strongylus vulgaris]